MAELGSRVVLLTALKSAVGTANEGGLSTTSLVESDLTAAESGLSMERWVESSLSTTMSSAGNTLASICLAESDLATTSSMESILGLVSGRRLSILAGVCLGGSESSAAPNSAEENRPLTSGAVPLTVLSSTAHCLSLGYALAAWDGQSLATARSLAH